MSSSAGKKPIKEISPALKTPRNKSINVMLINSFYPHDLSDLEKKCRHWMPAKKSS